MDRTDPWGDFETIKHNVKHNIVDKLKLIVTRLNEECGAGLHKTGKKQELIDKITNKLDIWRRATDVNSWMKARNILNEVRNGVPTATRATPTFNAMTYTNYPTSNASGPSTTHNANPMYQRLNQGRHDFYAQPRPGATTATSTAPSTSTTASIRFKPSPFFHVERAVSNVVECPESTNQIDRKAQTVTFTLTNDVIQKLASQSPTYQLRLYCTSSQFYMHNSWRSPNTLPPCPIEFPPTCEVRINNVAVTANLKGLKKKPGTAPPPNLAVNPQAIRMSPNYTNKVEMVYVNTAQQPHTAAAKPPPKKYYMVVMLVEVTTVEKLIERLQKGKYRSNTEILAKMQEKVDDEDDIVAGHQKMSLKCPLSYMRITTPCRSQTCVHPQCFDAFSWFSVMEQTTTWMCPVCEQVLNPEDLIIDGYFDEILKCTTEDVEDVIVEPDGQWHTTDNKYASASWKAAHPAPSSQSSQTKKNSLSPAKATLKQENGAKSVGPLNAEIVILDSDDEDDNRVKRELSPSTDGTHKSGRTTAHTSLRSLPSQSQVSDVIDLTLDSDDEDPPPLPPPPSHHIPITQPVTLSRKRASSELELTSPAEPAWKKGRMEPSTSRYAPSSSSNQSPSGSMRPLTSSSTGRFPNPYQLSSTLPYPSYPPYTAPPTASTTAPGSLPPRPNGNVNGRFTEDQYARRASGAGSSTSNGWR